MCTAISYQDKDHYFGRNLDLEYCFQEKVVITPTNFPFLFRQKATLRKHYAMIGMATVAENYPLYYEATNDQGLSMAGLNFPGNAVYHSVYAGKDNIAPFELIPWVLGQCKDVREAVKLLKNTNIVNIPFSAQYPLTPIHWILADLKSSVVAEQTDAGLELYNDPVGVLTNNPPFPYHLYNLQNYQNLTTGDPVCRFVPGQRPYSRGMGAIGLPGDASSASRYVRAAFIKQHTASSDREESAVSQFFHILNSVAMVRGCVTVDGKDEITQYSCCCNTNKGIYYYTTYENSQITAVHMQSENLERQDLICFPLVRSQQINHQN